MAGGPSPLSYFAVLAEFSDRFSLDIETHAYHDDVTLEEQRELEALVFHLRRARDLAHTIDARRDRALREEHQDDSGLHRVPPCAPVKSAR